MRYSQRTLTRPLPLSTLPFLVAAYAMLCSYAHAGECPSAPGQGNLCTAKDFTITSAIIDGPTECTIGETITARVRVGLTSTANQRYDIGIFTGDNGEPVFGGASCSLDSLTPLEPPFDGDSGFGGYRELDGDACGDMSGPDGEVFKDVLLDKVLCKDNDGDGQVDISGVVTWSSNASQDVCSNPDDPLQFFPSSSSKCILDPDFNLPIIVEPPPSLRVFKLALPGNLPEPGGPVLFVVDIKNNSAGTDTLTINSIIDSVHGDTTTTQGNDIIQTSCSVPQTLVAGQVYICEFVAEVTGSTGYVEQDTITATGVDDEGNTVVGMDTAEVVIGDAPASIVVGKSADPVVVNEPGGDVTYSVLVANESNAESVTIDSLEDNPFGTFFDPANPKGNCPTAPFTLAPLSPNDPDASIMRCEFIETVTGNFDPNGPNEFRNVVTANGPGIDPKDDDAIVTIADVAASIETTKTAIPASLPEPGGTFRFVWQLQNTSPVDDVTINNIHDNVYGDLTDDIENPGTTCVTGITLMPGEIYTCSFTGEFFGPPGAFQSDVITVRATDSDGGTEFDFATASVFISDVPSSLAVTKTPNRVEQISGGPVTYTVAIENTSAVDTVTLSSLDDNPYGDITVVGGAITATTCSLVPTIILPPRGNYTCEFTALITGSVGDLVTDTVSVAGVDDVPNIVIASDSAVVEIVDSGGVVPPLDVLVTKVALPSSIAVTELPGTVTYLARVTNPSINAIRVLSLSDDLYDLQNDDASKLPILSSRNCSVPFELAPGESRICLFSAAVDGAEGDVITDVVTAEVCELPACTLFASNSDDASVTITPNPVSLAVLKTAQPTTVETPGGPVSFIIQTTNTSPLTELTITSMGDDIYGDITVTGSEITSTDCATPQTLAPAGGSYSCSFTAQVTGVAGSEVLDIVTVAAEDASGAEVSASDSATVEILGLFPRVELTKSANPTIVRVPGEQVTFTAQVQNTSATEELTISSLVDDIYGDLNNFPDCQLPQVLPAAGVYTCQFTGNVTGDSAALHRNTLTMTGTDESGDPIADSDWAIVLILPLGPGGEPVAIPVNPLWLLIIASMASLGLGTLALSRRKRRKESAK